MPYKLTPSTISLLKDCPRCFWLQVKENKSRPESIYPSLPYGVDKVLKKRFDYFREKGKLPPELWRLGKNVMLCDNPLLALWKNNRQGIRWKDELGHELRGALDDVLQTGKNKQAVLEYATRGFQLKKDTLTNYQSRLDLYTFLLAKNGFEMENHAYLLFYYPKDVNWKGDLWFHKELHKVKVSVENGERLFRKALAVLEGDAPLSSKRCGFCSWNKV